MCKKVEVRLIGKRIVCYVANLLKLMHVTQRQVHKVATIPLCEKILECCRDMWALEIQDILHGCIDIAGA